MKASEAHYDAIYLSPHLDDVALSCGGRIFQATQQGKSVLIASVTASDPPTALSTFAEFQHAQWALQQNAVAARRAEDQVACRILGADWLHWDVYDCVYRTDPTTGEPFYVSDPDIFGKVHSADIGTMNRIVDLIASLPPCEFLFVPLTLGNHVDHQLTRVSAEHYCATVQPETKLIYYEDFPYAQHYESRSHVAHNGDWQAEIMSLSTAAIKARLDAINAFASQISTLFGSSAALQQQLTDFVNKTGGERYWHRSV